MRTSIRILGLALAFAALATPGFAAVVPSGAIPAGAAAAVSHKTYAAMTDAERLAYVAERGALVARALGVEGDRAVAVTPEAARLIKAYVDRYAARVGNHSTIDWKEDLATVFERASAGAPAVSRAFNDAGLPPVYGLYVAMVESEYHPCLTSPMNGRGVFQFIPQTGARYGLAGDDFCDIDKSAAAAAHYLADTRNEFSSSEARPLLALLAYNVGSKVVATQVVPATATAGGAGSAQGFWSVVAHPDRYGLSKDFQGEGARYVPAFFAAAIVGENPADFGLATRPLSSY